MTTTMMMKRDPFAALAVLAVALTAISASSMPTTAAAFLPHQKGVTAATAGWTTTTTTANRRIVDTSLAEAVELEPEPEGGDELSPTKSSLPDCRMKKMEALPDVKSDDGDVYKFWMTAVADGTLIKETRVKLLKEASKKANFPGFRKGQVPPYAQPQITQFSIQDSIIRTVESAVEAYGLKSLDGSDGEVTVHEDVSAMSKGYKVGEPLSFTATLNAALPATSSSGEDGEEAEEEVSSSSSEEAVVE